MCPRLRRAGPGAYPALLQRPEIEVAAAQVRVAAADQLQRGLPSCRGDVGHVDGAGEPTGGVQPPEAVHAPVAARHPGVPADGEGDLAPRADQFIGDLHAGRGGTDHEHAARREPGRVAVCARGDNLDASGQAG
jgi:hypothetical protein